VGQARDVMFYFAPLMVSAGGLNMTDGSVTVGSFAIRSDLGSTDSCSLLFVKLPMHASSSQFLIIYSIYEPSTDLH
jgi:hypothetical protein